MDRVSGFYGARGVHARALTAFTGKLRHHQLIELYHATQAMPQPLRARSAAWLKGQGLLHSWGWPPRYIITKEGWRVLRANWHRIADKVQGTL